MTNLFAHLTATARPAALTAARRIKHLGAIAVIGFALAGCAEQFQKGYILPEGALEQIPIGASQDQVLVVMGTPSTVATLSGEVFYYISQRTERRVAHLNRELYGEDESLWGFRTIPAWIVALADEGVEAPTPENAGESEPEALVRITRAPRARR